MERKVEGTNTGFLQQITRNLARWLGDAIWETFGATGVQEAAGTQSVMNYIGRHQATVSQWVALYQLFEVCARETGY